VLGIWLKFFASLLGRMPPDNHVWIVTTDVPAFVKFEGQLYMNGPVWRIELTTPRWPDIGRLANKGLLRGDSGAYRFIRM